MNAFLNRLLIALRWEFSPNVLRREYKRHAKLFIESLAFIVGAVVGVPLALLYLLLLPVKMLGMCIYVAFKYPDDAVQRLQKTMKPAPQ